MVTEQIHLILNNMLLYLGTQLITRVHLCFIEVKASRAALPRFPIQSSIKKQVLSDISSSLLPLLSDFI